MRHRIDGVDYWKPMPCKAHELPHVKALSVKVCSFRHTSSGRRRWWDMVLGGLGRCRSQPAHVERFDRTPETLEVELAYRFQLR
jgi:hypothetical protein